MKQQQIVVFLTVIMSTVLSGRAENWPSWRGPRGDGSAADAAPLRWNGASGQNVRWKTALPGEGHSSPIVWNDRIFVTACLPDSLERVLICIDRATGNLLWQRTVI